MGDEEPVHARDGTGERARRAQVGENDNGGREYGRRRRDGGFLEAPCSCSSATDSGVLLNLNLDLVFARVVGRPSPYRRCHLHLRCCCRFRKTCSCSNECGSGFGRPVRH